MKYFFFALACLLHLNAAAEQGRWPLHLLQNQAARFEQKGIQIPIQHLYDSANPSLNKALIVFNNGSGGVFISDQGLILCSLESISEEIGELGEKNSAINREGFWAQNRSQEIPLNSSVFITLKHAGHQTTLGRDLRWIDGEAPQILINDLSNKIDPNSPKLPNGTGMFQTCSQGNTEAHKYHIQIISDLRLVGISPSIHSFFGKSLGPWPNVEAPFVLLRAYGADGRPYQPQAHAKITLDGWHANDVVFSIHPFNDTDLRWAPSCMIRHKESQYSHDNQLLQRFIDLYHNLRTQGNYDFFNQRAKKYQALLTNNSNALKNISVSKIYDHKLIYEDSLSAWLNTQAPYKNIYEKYDTVAGNYHLLLHIKSILDANHFGPKIFDLIEMFIPIVEGCASDAKAREQLEAIRPQLLNTTSRFYENYNVDSDRMLHLALLALDETENTRLERFGLSNSILKLTNKQVIKAYQNSFFTSKTQCIDALVRMDIAAFAALNKDPLFQYVKSICDFRDFLDERIEFTYNERSLIHAQYTMADLAFRQATQRGPRPYPETGLFEPSVSIGHLRPMEAPNGMHYRGFTNLDDLMNRWKMDTSRTLSPHFVDLYNRKDFGPYVRPEDPSPMINFLASTDESPSGSGAPLFNKNGDLIGIRNQFYDVSDGQTLSSLYYDAAQHRVIYTDIRYILYFIDRCANAKHILREIGLN